MYKRLNARERRIIRDSSAPGSGDSPGRFRTGAAVRTILVLAAGMLLLVVIWTVVYYLGTRLGP